MVLKLDEGAIAEVGERAQQVVRPAGLDRAREERSESRRELETAGRNHCDKVGMVRPAGLEPATSWFVARRSIQLS
jgi:hypothetical protein